MVKIKGQISVISVRVYLILLHLEVLLYMRVFSSY